MSNTREGGPSDADYEQNEGKPDLSTDDLQRVEGVQTHRGRWWWTGGCVVRLAGRDPVSDRKWVAICIIRFNFEDRY